MSSVDIIIPTRNRVDLTLRAVLSVRAQTLTDWRCFVVDDASDQDKAEALREGLGDDPRIRFIGLPDNVGPMTARQLVLDNWSSAGWVTTMDSDDEIAPTKLEKQVALGAMGHDVVLCGHQWMRPDGTIRVSSIPSATGPRRPLVMNNVNVPLVARDLLERVGGFASRAGSPLSCGHIEWCTRLLSHAASPGVVDDILVTCHDHDSDRTSDLFGTAAAADELKSVASSLEGDLDAWPAARASLWMDVSYRYLEAGKRREAFSAFDRARRVSAPSAARSLARRWKFVASRLVRSPSVKR